jgi:hypothetical protein
VPLIPLAAGAQTLVDAALSGPGGPVEWLVGAGLAASEPAASAPVSERIVVGAHRLKPELTFLADHQLAGAAVLPLAVSLEWLARAARAVASGEALVALEDVRVLKGVTLSEGVIDLVAVSSVPLREGDQLVATVELKGRSGQVHVRARARLGAPAASPAPLAALTDLQPYDLDPVAIYGTRLFHGPSWHAIAGVEGVSKAGMELGLKAAVRPEALELDGDEFELDPLVIDGVFQALILWCRAQQGAPSLPSRLEAVQLYRPLRGDVRAVVRVRESDALGATSDIDLCDEAGVAVRLTGFTCTLSPSLDRAFQEPRAADVARPQ